MVIIKKKLTFSSNNYLQLLSILNQSGRESRLIGGCVRDALQNFKSSDIDIATTLQPQQVIQILTENEINFLTIGIDFGTITARINDEQIEITTLRRDLSSNGRYPKIVYTESFQEDAQRRDFTINSLSYCPFKHEIYDYCGGINDLKEARVIFIGDPETRIKEDYLRILRFFRFSGRFGGEFDKKGLNACIDLNQNLLSLSKERIKWEMDKIIALNSFESILEGMFKFGFLQIIFPISYFDVKAFEAVNIFAKERNIQVGFHAKYALIFYSANNQSIEKLIGLKFSKNEAVMIINIIEFAKDFNNMDSHFSLKKAWLENSNYLDYVIACIGIGKLEATVADNFISTYKDDHKPAFPVNGNDLINQGMHGEAIGKSLSYLKNEWIKNNFAQNRSQLLAILNDYNE